MKYLFIIILISPLFAYGQNPHDSIQVLYKSDRLIEILKPNLPKNEKRTKLDKINILNGAWIQEHNQLVYTLENGDVKIYNRFFELIEHHSYRDSARIFTRTFKEEKPISELKIFKKDTMLVDTYYYSNGNPKVQFVSTPSRFLTTHWYENRKIRQICEKSPSTEECDLWNSDGYFDKSIITRFKDGKIISKTEKDQFGNEIK